MNKHLWPLVFIILSSCSTLNFNKDNDFQSFEKAMNITIQTLKKQRRIKLVRSYESLLSFARDHWNTEELNKYVKSRFNIVPTDGKEGDGKILLTGYYSPILKVSHFKTKEFDTPIYSAPKNMKKPYLTRRQISKSYTRLKPYVIAYGRLVDVFFLHIQGSGIIAYEDGEKSYINFADHNGHQYVSIGKTLLDIIPREQMSMQSIKQYLASVNKVEREEILHRNPRFIFFKKSKRPPQTHYGTDAVAGRTIATDDSHYKKPGLGFIEMDKGSRISSRFVFDHDIGGGVKGEHRVDLYIGEGLEAESAGKLYERGRLYYLVPKSI